MDKSEASDEASSNTGGLKRSSSRGQLSALGAGTPQTMLSRGTNQFATSGTPSDAPPRAAPKSGLLKRSRSMGTFDGIISQETLSVGREAVESISGRVSVPQNGGAVQVAPTSVPAGNEPVPAVVAKPSPGPNSGIPVVSAPPSKDKQVSVVGGDAPASPASTASTVSKSSPRSPTATGILSPDPLVLDDSNLQRSPLMRVDYFSHDWNEMDIAGSWRYIVSRRNDMANSARLENASWRTWAKAKYNLKTVSPETVNWLKDYDVTWLYGPLYHDHSEDEDEEEEPLAVPDSTKQTSKTESDAKGLSSNRKPKKPLETVKSILKKKTLAQIMLEDTPQYSAREDQESPTTTDYLRHHNYRHTMGGSNREHMANLLNQQYTNPSPSKSRPGSQLDLNHSGTSQASIDSSERHVRFNVRVEQCIALDPDEEEVPPAKVLSPEISEDEEDDDDECGLFLGIRRSGSNVNLMNSNTIAPLPATTLKYPAEDTESAVHHEDTNRAVLSSGARRGFNANYDYGSVYSSSQSYKIVDPAVQAVELPSAVANQTITSSPSTATIVHVPSTPSPQGASESDKPHRSIKPTASFGFGN